MPEWLSEWDFERNDVAPGKVAVTSARKVWWKCGKGHAYLSSPSCRIRGHGCVYCSGKEILTGFNDFASGYPELLEEWDYRKNRVDPSKISRFTHRRVWWIDRKGHEWMASVSNRSAGKGCPYCGGTKVLSGFNDLRTVTPWIAEEWDDERNGNLKPEHVFPYTNRKVWWKCENGHHWKSTINSRQKGAGYPYCHGLIPRTPHFIS